jgi:hypothetical protein
MRYGDILMRGRILDRAGRKCFDVIWLGFSQASRGTEEFETNPRNRRENR